jgi:hypothetical protein
VSTRNYTPIITTNSINLEAIEFLNFLSLLGGQKTTLEHVGQFILQCGETSANDILKLRFVPLSLSSTIFTLLTSLAPNSIFTYA